MFVLWSSFLSLASLASLASAQLTQTVGPTTSHASKRSKICSVLDYGGSIGSSDIGPAIGKAFTSCVKGSPGSTLYVPAGSYSMSTWQTLSGGSQWAFQLDGLITRTGTASGHMIVVQSATDVEVYSSNSAGGFQGNGYQVRNAGPRLLRMISVTSFSVHDLIFTDSPEFHLIIDGGSRGEIYNLAIRGANLGGSDGIDISGDNHWVHDVEVTNRDECVTIKSPASNFLIEQIWCNQSGGSAFGSLNGGTAVSNIIYRYIYTNGGNQAMMFKSNGGDGYVKNVQLTDFIFRDTAYGLYLNQYWSSESVQPGNGVSLTNIAFSNWNGIVVDGVQRPVIGLICADTAPCSGITLSNINIWSETGKANVRCESAFGSGVACVRSGSTSSYAATSTAISQPSGYSSPSTLPGDLGSTGFGSTIPIPTPTIPSTYYPGRAQITPLQKNLANGGSGPTTTTKPATTASVTSTTRATTTTSGGGGSGTVPRYGQCGGTGWTGGTVCISPYVCTYSNDYYSQCL